MPADQRAPERKERFVDIGPLVIADAQAPELIQPGKRALNDPPPPTQATAMLRTAHGQQRKNVARSQTSPDNRGVVRAITQHAFRTAPRSSAVALQRGNRIDE